ncbi:MAG TPA: SURF1 family protein [Steroidobacteraceae bacterium]|nr:SURF1 family protein [Steroidobacteraceae bacterium]
MTLVTVLLLASFVSLGRWQWHRGEAKQLAWAEFDRATTQPPVDAPAHLDTAPRYQMIRLRGRFDGQHQFLLDNRFFKGEVGYEVLTPFAMADGRRILVNRGWVPFLGYRDRLPDISLPRESVESEVTIIGRLDELPSPGLASGRAPPAADANWPKLTAFPSHEELQSALREPIARRLVLMSGAGDGFAREWSPPGLAPDRHFSYAIQWWGFALVLLVLYFGLNFRKVS